MRRTWQIVFVLSALVWVGCKTKGESTPPPPPEPSEQTPEAAEAPDDAPWPDVPCPPGTPTTARMRLDDIIAWAGGAEPEVTRARLMATACRDIHTINQLVHREKLLRAWAKAEHVFTNPHLPPHEKELIWGQCADELTHGPDGS